MAKDKDTREIMVITKVLGRDSSKAISGGVSGGNNHSYQVRAHAYISLCRVDLTFSPFVVWSDTTHLCSSSSTIGRLCLQQYRERKCGT